jgi:hypothetical protein
MPCVTHEVVEGFTGVRQGSGDIGKVLERNIFALKLGLYGENRTHICYKFRPNHLYR